MPCASAPPVYARPVAEDAITALASHHLRAARALLGWAMSDLAQVSGLSLSTIRRLEQDMPAVSPRNRRSAVEALRTAGIRFLALDDGTIALADRGATAVSARLVASEFDRRRSGPSRARSVR